MSDDNEPDSGRRCDFCAGTGTILAQTAYIAGPAPFTGLVNSLAQSRPCKRCHATGTYTSAEDPALDPDRDPPTDEDEGEDDEGDGE